MTEELKYGILRNNYSSVVKEGLEPASSGFQDQHRNYSRVGIMILLSWYCWLTYLTDSSGIFHFATPAQTELKADPFTALRERFRLAKDYSSTARAAQDTSSTPTLSRHCRLQQGIPSTGLACDSKVNPNIEELGQLQCFNTEKHLDNTEEKKTDIIRNYIGRTWSQTRQQ